MAVEDKYVNDNLADDSREVAVFSGGDNLKVAVNTEEIAAADSDGSVYRFFKGWSSQRRIHKILLFNDAITGGTDYDIGLYKSDLGAVIDKDCFADGLDLSVASQGAISSLAGSLTGTVDGTIADVAAIALSTAGGNTYTDAVVNSAVNTAITSVNLQLKELQTKLNEAIARLANSGFSASKDGMQIVDLPNFGKSMYELASGETDADHNFCVDIALTANTVGSGAGSVTMVVLYS